MDDTAAAEITLLLRGAPGIAPDAVRATALLQSAAKQGDGFAMMRLAVLAAGGIGCARDWERAVAMLRNAVAAGDANAAAQLRILSVGGGEIDLDALMAPPTLTPLSQEAGIGVAHGFVPPAFCPWIIEQGRDRLVPGMVGNFQHGGYEVGPGRTATACPFGPIKRDLVIAVLQERAARLCGVPVTHHEAPNLISYEPGQRFNTHFDFLAPNQPGMQAELAERGQRTTTFISYLNEDFADGATQFPTLGFEFRGKIGDAVVFSNVMPDGAPDRRMLHAGAPPTSGRKWVLSQWIRSKPQAVR